MAGINVGDVILQVNRKPVNTSSAFKFEIDHAAKDKRVLLLVRTKAGQRYVLLRW